MSDCTRDVQVKRICKNMYVISVVLTVEPVRRQRLWCARCVSGPFWACFGVKMCKNVAFVVEMFKNVSAPNFNLNQIFIFFYKKKREHTLSLLRIRITYTLLRKILHIPLLRPLLRNLHLSRSSLAVVHKLPKQCRRLLCRNTHQLTDSRSGHRLGVEMLQHFSLDGLVLLLLLRQRVLALLIGTVHSRNLLGSELHDLVSHLAVGNSIVKFPLRHNIFLFLHCKASGAN